MVVFLVNKSHISISLDVIFVQYFSNPYLVSKLIEVLFVVNPAVQEKTTEVYTRLAYHKVLNPGPTNKQQIEGVPKGRFFKPSRFIYRFDSWVETLSHNVVLGTSCKIISIKT